MIHQLRRRFVMISVAVLAVAMLLLTAAINAVNWMYVRQDLADTALELVSSSAETTHGKWKTQKGHSSEALYGSRYFTVSLIKGGWTAELSNVSSYTEEEALGMAEAAQALNADSGLMDECYFLKYTSGSHEAILFLDCGSRLSAVRQLILISASACVGGILLSWLLVSLLSKRAVRPFMENSEKQKRFITDASHELKTPLSVISANMDVLAMDAPDNEWILSTRRQVGLMNRMVRDMVFLARADEGTRPPRTAFDLAQLLKDTAEPFVMMAGAQNRTFTVAAPESCPARGDAKGIERLISVLCDNAVKYSPEGDALSVSLTRKGAFAVIETENTPAEPVSEEKLKHLFDRFYRADESRAKAPDRSGFGIGLAIAQAVAETHDGSARAFQQNGRIHIVCRLKV